MAICGGGITLPACKYKVIVTIPTGDPMVVERLEETWVRLYGVPPPLRHADRLLLSTREIGRPIGVDADSLAHPSNPIRMSFGCRSPALLPNFITLFVNMEGFKIRVAPEAANVENSPPLAPPPSHNKDREEEKDEDMEETDDDRWDGRRGRHAPKEGNTSQSAPAGGKAGPARKSVPISGQESPPQAPSLPSTAFSQYGSNLTEQGDIFPIVAKILNPALATPQPLPSLEEAERLSPSVLSPEDSNKEETSYFGSVEEKQDGTSVPLGLHQAPAILENTNVLPLADEDPIPALGAPVTRGPRSRSATPSEALRKSARGAGLTEGSVLERAVRLANDKDAPSSSTPGTPPPPPSPLSAFTAFQDMSAQKLLKVAQDSCVIFPSAAGAPEDIISLIQAKELAQADLAVARYRAELEAAKVKALAEQRSSPAQEGTVLETGASPSATEPASIPKKKRRVYKKKQPTVGTRPLTRRARALSMVSQ
ncbi:hypothetical protein QYE76_052040 [Lolium multiflorum]|uniref:DUF4283 domain-containing protein n=1 Tax=Lolium multiflorum TaxID=4521 RepID=A0AAD8WJ54_LOLMU|nr:hypothetical protein QYE76_052040 [Lolium multiflorum]